MVLRLKRYWRHYICSSSKMYCDIFAAIKKSQKLNRNQDEKWKWQKKFTKENLLWHIGNESKKKLSIWSNHRHLAHIMQYLWLHIHKSMALNSQPLITQIYNSCERIERTKIQPHVSITYAVSSPVSFNNNLNFCSMPWFLVVSFFM